MMMMMMMMRTPRPFLPINMSPWEQSNSHVSVGAGVLVIDLEERTPGDRHHQHQHLMLRSNLVSDAVAPLVLHPVDITNIINN
jgi:hypothetical protein